MTLSMKNFLLSCTLITASPLVAMDVNPLAQNAAALPANIERAIAPFEQHMQAIEANINSLNDSLIQAFANSDELDSEMQKISDFINAYQTQGFNQDQKISLNTDVNYHMFKTSYSVSQILLTVER